MANQVNTSHERPVDSLDDIREKAAQWLLCLDDCSDRATRARLQTDCERWQQEDPRRRQVFLQMREMSSALEDNGHAHKRWQVMGLLVLALLGPLLLVQLPWQLWSADHRTGIAEIRELVLSDGSRLVLDADSAVDVSFDRHQRVIELIRGQLKVVVAADSAERPFSVRTPTGDATALGTVYGVQRRADDSLVTVLESRVRLTPKTEPDAAVTLSAGQRAQLTGTAVGPIQMAGRYVLDWASQRLVFNDAPLSDVIAQLDRYRHGWVFMSERLVAHDLRFTGVLPTDDSDRALLLLSEALRLDVHRMTPYAAWLDIGQSALP